MDLACQALPLGGHRRGTLALGEHLPGSHEIFEELATLLCLREDRPHAEDHPDAHRGAEHRPEHAADPGPVA